MFSFFALLFAGLESFLDSILCFNGPRQVKINMSLALFGQGRYAASLENLFGLFYGLWGAGITYIEYFAYLALV